MVQNYGNLLKEALNLPETDKIHLLSDLFEHIISTEQKEREQLWAEEAERRLEAYDKGNLESEEWNSLKKRL